ncbi:MAG TPA: zinc-binding alcohol dehydrogenase [Thermomicrobiales bacterium]|jgi:threonine dehydrogenase-like Zn-dependent dehydrogenase
MPKELVAIAPRSPVLRDYDEPDLGECQIRIRAEFASPKHGTELVGYRDEPAANRPYDAALGAMMPITEEGRGRRFPMRLGNMAVGVVTETGPGVTRFAVDDRVFGHLPIRETHTVDEAQVDPMPAGLSDEAAVCLDPVVMALAMRDAGIKLGDHVAVFGLGAIGLIAVQLARAAGAGLVVAVDPIGHRREVAMVLGVDVALDPVAEGDVGLAIRRRTGWRGAANTPPSPDRTRVRGGYWEGGTQSGQLGVDVAVEVSGSSRALHDAIRATRFGGTVCVLSYYGREATGLHLGEEFHVNRLQLVSARAESLPLRDAPAWNLARYVDVALAWLASGRLRADGIVWPVVPFAESAEAYRAIDEHPEQSIKLGVRF